MYDTYVPVQYHAVYYTTLLQKIDLVSSSIAIIYFRVQCDESMAEITEMILVVGLDPYVPVHVHIPYMYGTTPYVPYVEC